MCARLEAAKWKRPQVFEWLKRHGNIDEAEMQRTFNCGIGMAVVVPQAEAKKAIDAFAREGVEAFEVGAIVRRDAGMPQTVVV
jgi:phosphoribosylformylglycinamidine cyclo-ligase